MGRADICRGAAPLRPYASALAILCALAAVATRAQDASPTPFFDARAHTPQYVGPGRDLPPPANLSEVAVAFFAPPDVDDPEWGDACRAAILAIEEVNAAGGYGGLPFRLLHAWSENRWGSAASDLAKLVYGRGVWAVIGGVDGVTTHLAEQIVVKARLALVSPGGTDPSVNFTNVAWMFTLPATDDLQAPLLAQALSEGRRDERWSVVSTTARDAASAWHTLRTTPALRALRPLRHVVVAASQLDYGATLADVARDGGRAVLVLADARDAGRIVKALRSQGYGGRIVGGATLGRRVFATEAGSDAEGVVFPLLFDTAQPGAQDFATRFRDRWRVTPDYLAAHTYDAVLLVASAVRRAGLNRALIRDALAASPASPGVSGPIEWDPTGRNARPVTLGVWRSGEPTRWTTGGAGAERARSRRVLAEEREGQSEENRDHGCGASR